MTERLVPQNGKDESGRERVPMTEAEAAQLGEAFNWMLASLSPAKRDRVLAALNRPGGIELSALTAIIQDAN